MRVRADKSRIGGLDLGCMNLYFLFLLMNILENDEFVLEYEHVEFKECILNLDFVLLQFKECKVFFDVSLV